MISGFGPSAFADGTRTWEQSKFEDLTKGTATGVAIRSSGGLELAPSFKLLYATPSTYIWAVAADESGNVYAATGSPARVYRITPDGTATIIFEPQELQVQTLEVGPHGVIYAATAPDGKVYKIEHQAREKADTRKGSKTSEKDAAKDSAPPKDSAKPALDPSWTSSEYFAPGTKYIWDLVLDKAGNLYVATGDHGEIYKVTPKGEHSLFFKSDDTHIRVLALDAQGKRNCRHRWQRPGISHFSGGRWIRTVQRSQERDHCARARSRRQHLMPPASARSAAGTSTPSAGPAPISMASSSAESSTALQRLE